MYRHKWRGTAFNVGKREMCVCRVAVGEEATVEGGMGGLGGTGSTG